MKLSKEIILNHEKTVSDDISHWSIISKKLNKVSYALYTTYKATKADGTEYPVQTRNRLVYNTSTRRLYKLFQTGNKPFQIRDVSLKDLFIPADFERACIRVSNVDPKVMEKTYDRFPALCYRGLYLALEHDPLVYHDILHAARGDKEIRKALKNEKSLEKVLELAPPF